MLLAAENQPEQSQSESSFGACQLVSGHSSRDRRRHLADSAAAERASREEGSEWGQGVLSGRLTGDLGKDMMADVGRSDVGHWKADVEGGHFESVGVSVALPEASEVI